MQFHLKTGNIAWLYLIFILGNLLACQAQNTPSIVQNQNDWVELWLTNADQSALFTKQSSFILSPNSAQKYPLIEINPEQVFQTMDGFGYTLTGGSALHIHRMSPSIRKALLEELFGQAEGQIGVSYLRLSVGASDLDEKAFSYNDLPTGETDPDLLKFSLAPDKVYLIPVLKEILQINPKIKLMASPWSPPAWMKTNQDSRGGSLKPEYNGVYARYLAKYIQAMSVEGIDIEAITVQNEPLHPGNNPSLLMPAKEQAEFVKNHLGPTFQKAGIKTKIIIYDHNADRPDYPISILNDSEAKKYIDGSAFHLYGGEVSAISKVQQAHPDKNLYFTEQWIGAPANFAEDFKWHIRELIIGASRNWCKTVLEWNLAADAQQKPHTDRGGCDRCLGAITIEGDKVSRNPAYYIIAHASKFVRPGAVRISSTNLTDLPNVAFKTPEDNTVLIVLNNNKVEQTFQIKNQNQVLVSQLKAGSVGTYVFKKKL
jgi:glucosylceramidase